MRKIKLMLCALLVLSLSLWFYSLHIDFRFFLRLRGSCDEFTTFSCQAFLFFFFAFFVTDLVYAVWFQFHLALLVVEGGDRSDTSASFAEVWVDLEDEDVISVASNVVWGRDSASERSLSSWRIVYIWYLAGMIRENFSFSCHLFSFESFFLLSFLIIFLILFMDHLRPPIFFNIEFLEKWHK